MQNTIDFTRTALRNIPSAPSLMDKARRQSKQNGTAVMYRSQFGFRTALPTDGPGDTNLGYAGRYDDVYEALVSRGYTVEVLGLEALA